MPQNHNNKRIVSSIFFVFNPCFSDSDRKTVPKILWIYFFFFLFYIIHLNFCIGHAQMSVIGHSLSVQIKSYPYIVRIISFPTWFWCMDDMTWLWTTWFWCIWVWIFSFCWIVQFRWFLITRINFSTLLPIQHVSLFKIQFKSRFNIRKKRPLYARWIHLGRKRRLKSHTSRTSRNFGKIQAFKRRINDGVNINSQIQQNSKRKNWFLSFSDF